MEFEQVTRRQSVREGFVVLLRAEATLLLPLGEYDVIRSFYERIGEACMNWVTEIYGEELRRHFLSLTEIREKSRYQTQAYRFWMRSPWEGEGHVTILCESTRSMLDGTRDFYRICHTWNCKEQSALPPTQCKRLFDFHAPASELPFSPDGFYREGDRMVIYKNANREGHFMEVSFPISNS